MGECLAEVSSNYSTVMANLCHRVVQELGNVQRSGLPECRNLIFYINPALLPAKTPLGQLVAEFVMYHLCERLKYLFGMRLLRSEAENSGMARALYATIHGPTLKQGREELEQHNIIQNPRL